MFYGCIVFILIFQLKTLFFKVVLLFHQIKVLCCIVGASILAVSVNECGECCCIRFNCLADWLAIWLVFGRFFQMRTHVTHVFLDLIFTVIFVHFLCHNFFSLSNVLSGIRSNKFQCFQQRVNFPLLLQLMSRFGIRLSILFLAMVKAKNCFIKRICKDKLFHYHFFGLTNSVSPLYCLPFKTEIPNLIQENYPSCCC